MDEIKDPILEKRGTFVDNQEPFTNGLYISGLTKKQIELFGLFFNDLYEKMRNKYRPRQITRNALTMLQGAIFSLGTKTLNNPEWKEHCASSLREILHEWDGSGKFESDFVLFYRDQNTCLTSKELIIFKEFRLRYQYFSSIDHHEASGIMNSIIALSKDSSLKLEDCYNDKVFFAQVKGFFSNLSKIIEFSEKIE